MINLKHLMSAATAAAVAATLVACQSASPSLLTTPTALQGAGSDVNADGSTMKASAPNAVFPLADSTGIPVEAILTAQQAKAVHVIATFTHRFQISDANDFANLLANDFGGIDEQGLVRFQSPALPNNKKVFWRVRAEQADKAGPWSNTMSFTTVAPATNTPSPTPTPTPPTGNRPADPPPGSRLPLPDARPAINRAQGRLATLNSCPNGRKYENNPWQDSLVDDLRTSDLRWGYNGKPTRTAADNGGFPVIAAGDEIAYHYGPGPDQGSHAVYLIDTLESHCGTPRTTYRDFTGEEDGFWTGAGRFQGLGGTPSTPTKK
jgi:hypothetical protein